jgi:chromosome segregation ATPase
MRRCFFLALLLLALSAATWSAPAAPASCEPELLRLRQILSSLSVESARLSEQLQEQQRRLTDLEDSSATLSDELESSRRLLTALQQRLADTEGSRQSLLERIRTLERQLAESESSQQQALASWTTYSAAAERRLHRTAAISGGVALAVGIVAGLLLGR